MHKFEISVPCIHCVQLSVQYTVPVVHEGLGHVLDEGDAQLDVGAEVEEEEPADGKPDGAGKTGNMDSDSSGVEFNDIFVPYRNSSLEENSRQSS